MKKMQAAVEFNKLHACCVLLNFIGWRAGGGRTDIVNHESLFATHRNTHADTHAVSLSALCVRRLRSVLQPKEPRVL